MCFAAFCCGYFGKAMYFRLVHIFPLLIEDFGWIVGTRQGVHRVLHILLCYQLFDLLGMSLCFMSSLQIWSLFSHYLYDESVETHCTETVYVVFVWFRSKQRACVKKHNQKVIGSLLILVCLDITVRPKIILVVLNHETIKPSPTLLQVYVKTALVLPVWVSFG